MEMQLNFYLYMYIYIVYSIIQFLLLSISSFFFLNYSQL